MPKPTTKPRWIATGARAVPASTKQDVGYAPGEQPPAQFVNEHLANTYEWIQYLDTFESDARTWLGLHNFRAGLNVQNGAGTDLIKFLASGAMRFVGDESNLLYDTKALPIRGAPVFMDGGFAYSFANKRWEATVPNGSPSRIVWEMPLALGERISEAGLHLRSNIPNATNYLTYDIKAYYRNDNTNTLTQMGRSYAPSPGIPAWDIGNTRAKYYISEAHGEPAFDGMAQDYYLQGEDTTAILEVAFTWSGPGGYTAQQIYVDAPYVKVGRF